MNKLEVLLERASDGNSRLIVFEVDAADGARSVRDIVEAQNDFCVVTGYLETLMGWAAEGVLLVRNSGEQEGTKVEARKTREGFINHIFFLLKPIGDRLI